MNILLIIFTWLFIGYFTLGALITRGFPSIAQLYFYLGLVVCIIFHILQLRGTDGKMIRSLLKTNLVIICIIIIMPSLFGVVRTML